MGGTYILVMLLAIIPAWLHACDAYGFSSN